MFGNFQFGTSYFAQAEETAGGAMATFNGFQLALTFGNASASALVAGGGSGRVAEWPPVFSERDRQRHEPPVFAGLASFTGSDMFIRLRPVKAAGESSQTVDVIFPASVSAQEQDELLLVLALAVEDDPALREVEFVEAPRRRKALALVGPDPTPGW